MLIPPIPLIFLWSIWLNLPPLSSCNMLGHSQFWKITNPEKKTYNSLWTCRMYEKKESISAERSALQSHPAFLQWVSGWGVVPSTPSAPLRFSPWRREGLSSCHPRNERLISMFILSRVGWKISTGDLCVKHCRTVAFYYRERERERKRRTERKKEGKRKKERGRKKKKTYEGSKQWPNAIPWWLFLKCTPSPSCWRLGKLEFRDACIRAPSKFRWNQQEQPK